MKKKILKVLALVACAVLLVVGSIAGTLAYMTSTATVKNTFTVGNVTITMDEAVVDANGKATAERTTTGTTYKLIPNHEYDKDPTIRVAADSEQCWLFVKVENGIEGIEAAGDTTIAKQLEANGWTLVAGQTNVYAHEDVASASANVVVFKSFKISGNVTNDDLDDYEGKTVTVTAYAVQADGFGTAAAAWTATFGAQTQG